VAHWSQFGPFTCCITRQRQFRQFMASSQGFSSGLYFRLMIISSTEILGTIPLGTYILVRNAQEGVGPWRSWASTHRHYSAVYQIPGSIWQNNRQFSQSPSICFVGCLLCVRLSFSHSSALRKRRAKIIVVRIRRSPVVLATQSPLSEGHPMRA
jgi:hypothetical protein